MFTAGDASMSETHIIHRKHGAGTVGQVVHLYGTDCREIQFPGQKKTYVPTHRWEAETRSPLSAEAITQALERVSFQKPGRTGRNWGPAKRELEAQIQTGEFACWLTVLNTLYASTIEGGHAGDKASIGKEEVYTKAKKRCLSEMELAGFDPADAEKKLQKALRRNQTADP